MADSIGPRCGNDRSWLKACTGLRAFVLDMVVAVVGLAMAVACGCTSKSAGPTPLAPSVAKFLKGGESYTATVTCHPGEEILARVSQDNIDVTLELADGNGNGSGTGGTGGTDDHKVDFPSGRFGDEFLTFRCGAAGHHRIAIAGVAQFTPGGTIRIETYGLSSAPASVAAGFRHLSDAARKNVVRGDHTWKDVIEELSSAAEIWKSRGMQRELALTDFAIGYVHYMDLTEWQSAADWAKEAARLFAALGDEVGAAASRQLQGAALEEAAAALSGSMDDPARQRLFIASESLPPFCTIARGY